MKTSLVAAILAAAGLMGLAACSPMTSAAPGPGYGPGYGMMGAGPYGGGYGMMGPGMMGGGLGMMGPGFGGPGAMMGGWGGLPADLTPDQRAQIAAVQRELRTKQWPLAQQMHELAWASGERGFDEPTERRDYDRLSAIHKQMFDNMLDARKRIDAVLAPQQREQLRRGPRG